MKYAVVYKRSKTGFGAYVPDLPGLGVTGSTLRVTKARVVKVIEMYLEDLQDDGAQIPKSTTQVDYAEVGHS